MGVAGFAQKESIILKFMCKAISALEVLSGWKVRLANARSGLLSRSGEEYAVRHDQTQRANNGYHEVVNGGRVDEEVKQPQQR